MEPEPTTAPSPKKRRIPRAVRNLLIAVGVIVALYAWAKIDAARAFERKAQTEIPKLIADLSNAEPYSRSRAAVQLSHFGPRAREATPALVKALEDPDYHARRSAADALRNIGPEVLPSVLPLLDGGNRETRLMVLRLIEDFGAAAAGAAPRIIKDMESSDSEVARQAHSALSALGEAALPEILGHLKQAKPQLRRQLIETIAPHRVKAERIVPALVRILEEDPDPLVKWQVLEVLLRYKKDAAPATAAAARALESQDQLVRSYASDVLAQIGSDAFEPVLAACSHPRVEVRERALHALGAIGEKYKTAKVLEVLKTAAGDPDWTIRRVAFSGICGLKAAAASCAPLAVKGLQDTRPEVRLTAAATLERLEVSTPDVLAALEKAESDPDPQVRLYAGIARSRLTKKN